MAPRGRSRESKTRTGKSQAGATPPVPADVGGSAPATATVAGAPGPPAPAGDGTAATVAVAGVPGPPGWPLLTSSAAKVWRTLEFVAPMGQATAEQLAALSGLSVRTVYSTLE